MKKMNKYKENKKSFVFHILHEVSSKNRKFLIFAELPYY